MTDKIFSKGTIKLIFSLPRSAEYQKIVVRPVQKQGEPLFLFEKFKGKQVFHENVSFDTAREQIAVLSVEYGQVNSFTEESEITLKTSKKGKQQIFQRKLTLAPKVQGSHNREKNYILKEGTAVPALVELGVLTRDGAVVAAKYNKFKQINRYIEFIDDVVGKCGKKELSIVDFGCGKSYLTFVLYHYLTEIKGIRAKIVGLDLKRDVTEDCEALARKFDYEGLSFICCDIKDYVPGGKVDMVVSLHACDTATDFALFNAIKWQSEFIFAVPCCQHELNETISGGKFALMQEFGIVKERFSALATDTCRAKLLTASGYETQLLEFIDISHSPKNILIRASRKNISPEKRTGAMDEVREFLKESGGRNTLFELLK